VILLFLLATGCTFDVNVKGIPEEIELKVPAAELLEPKDSGDADG
jgi:predicted component of type VI protein secretion system